MSEELKKLEGKNWVAAMALCWAFGAIGGHRFYTRKSTTAWVMVVLTILGFTAPISAIWAIVDGVMIALGKFRAEDGGELYEKITWLGYTYIVVTILSVIGFFVSSFFMLSLLAALAAASAGAYPPIAP